ncbi:phospholipase D-like domain-containing protein [Breznakiella homolactica]|uniref:Phospholipase D family protein n=1 Tax=Breznakiella homolactica TaxID=2798577 RepID=A0A7T7XQX9_9SPIR|nr:phospholipase D family protein [Breznakiella homolactica]QQO10855.1 phospholipase D family protein [Breznakiella homolactica]
MRKAVKYTCIAYLLYVLGASTLSYARPKTMREESKKSLEKQFLSETGDPGPDRIALVEDCQEGLGIRIRMLRSARRSADIAYHTVHKGETTDAFFGEILSAAQRGVKVRILLDGKVGVTSGEISNILKTLDSHENISCRLYNPINWLKPWKWHALLHDKFIIVDDELLLLGGRNIGDKYFAPPGFTGKITNDRDVFVWKASGAGPGAADQVRDYMDSLWDSPYVKPLSAGKRDEPLYAKLSAAGARFEESYPVFFSRTLEDYKGKTVPAAKITLVYNPINAGPKEAWVGYQLADLAVQATDTVYIQTPYATANRKLLETLTETCSDAQTSILTNSMASSPNFPAFSNYSSQRKKFVGTGVSIYEYQDIHSIHGKSFIFDERLSAVGSYNLDDRSFYIDTETMLVIDSPEFASILSGAMDSYRGSSLKVGQDNNYEPNPAVAPVPVSRMKKFIMGTASVVSRLFQFLI